MSARAYRSRATSCGTPSTMSSSTGSCSQASITNRVPFFSRFDGACTTSGRAASDGGVGVNVAQVEPRRDHVRAREPSGSRRTSRRSPRRRACRTRARPGSCRGCPSRGSGRRSSSAASAGAGTAATSGSASGRSRSGRRPSAARAARTPRTAAASRRGSAAVPVERPVRLGMQPPALEDDEPRVDPLPPQRLDVLPRDAGDVDGRVRDPKRCGRVTFHLLATVHRRETWLTPSRVAFELVEVAQRCSARADAGGVARAARRRRSRRSRA